MHWKRRPGRGQAGRAQSLSWEEFKSVMTRFPDARQRGSLITARKSDSDSESRRLAEPESESRDYDFLGYESLSHWCYGVGTDQGPWSASAKSDSLAALGHGSESLVGLRRRV